MPFYYGKSSEPLFGFRRYIQTLLHAMNYRSGFCLGTQCIRFRRCAHLYEKWLDGAFNGHPEETKIDMGIVKPFQFNDFSIFRDASRTICFGFVFTSVVREVKRLIKTFRKVAQFIAHCAINCATDCAHGRLPRTFRSVSMPAIRIPFHPSLLTIGPTSVAQRHPLRASLGVTV
jgi:hypothetical protein